MKTYKYISILILILSGCQNPAKGLRKDPGHEKTSVTENKEAVTHNSDIKICTIPEEESLCSLSDKTKRKLAQLSQSGIMTESVLDLHEVQKEYQLNPQKLDCLKTNYCKGN